MINLNDENGNEKGTPQIHRAGEVLEFTSKSMTPETFVDQVIIRVRFKETTSYGRMAICAVQELDDNGEPIEFHTTSHVLVDQLETIMVKGKFPVLASVVTGVGASGRPYFKLE